MTYALGHLTLSSSQSSFDNIQPNPGKKSERYNVSGLDSSMSPTFPLSFHAETHHSVLSALRSGKVPRKYS